MEAELILLFHHHDHKPCLWIWCLPQSKEEDPADDQKVKLLNGVKNSDDEEGRREMITPALREALTKQGEENGQ